MKRYFADIIKKHQETVATEETNTRTLTILQL